MNIFRILVGYSMVPDFVGQQPPVVPDRSKIAKIAAVAAIASGFVGPPLVPNPVPAPTVDRYLIPLNEPVRFKRTHPAYAPYASEVLGFVTSEATSEDKWHQPWSEPVRFKRIHVSAIASGQIQTLLPETLLPGPAVEAAWHYPWSEPKRFKPALATGSQPYVGQFHPTPVVSFSYYNWLAEPVRFKKIHVSAIASGLTWTPQPETFYPGADNEAQWHYPWSQPVWPKKGMGTVLQVSGATWPLPLDAIFPGPTNEAQWNYAWSEPKRFPRGLPYYQQRFAFEDPANTTLPKTRPVWFAPLSEPVRLPKRLHAALNPFDLLRVPVVPPSSDFIGWFASLSQPLYPKQGLKVHLQSTVAWPPRLLPTPDISVVMRATETNGDEAEIAIVVYNAAASAKVSIVEGPRNPAALSMRES